MHWITAIKTPKHLVLAVADRVGKVEGAEAEVASLSSHLRWVAGYTKEEGWPGIYLAALFSRAGRKEETAHFAEGHQPLVPIHWKHFGVETPTPHLGDVGIFRWEREGFVGLYLGEAEDWYLMLGGVGSRKVDTLRIPKENLIAWRRPKYKVLNPNLGQVYLGPDGCPAP